MKDSDLIELVKELERRYGCACEIDVKITGKEIKKYGDLRKRSIKVVAVPEIDSDDIRNDIRALSGNYNSMKELEETISRNINFAAVKRAFSYKYHVKEDRIFIDEKKVANIIYERLK